MYLYIIIIIILYLLVSPGSVLLFDCWIDCFYLSITLIFVRALLDEFNVYLYVCVNNDFDGILICLRSLM